MTDRELMYAAIEEANSAAAEGEVPVGAVIACKGEILCRFHNKTEAKGNPLYHAEIIAINDALARLDAKYLTECTLYVTLEPCPMCAGASINAGINRVVFGAYDYKFGAFGGCEDLSRVKGIRCPQIQGGFLERECSQLLSDFFKKIRE